MVNGLNATYKHFCLFNLVQTLASTLPPGSPPSLCSPPVHHWLLQHQLVKMRLWCCCEPPQSGALPMLATDPAAWTCSTVQSHSNSLPLFFYLLPQGATTERSDYPPIKSWQFAAINRDRDSQSAWQFLRTGLQCLICSKSGYLHPGLQCSTWWTYDFFAALRDLAQL